MRLHKLLYYVQGWHLAMRGRPFFEARIEGWQHGPVVREVYPKFADYGDSAIPAHEACAGKLLEKGDVDFIQSIWDSYKQYSAIELRRKTHNERPWIESRIGLGSEERGDRPLKSETMREFFREEYRKSAPRGLDLGSLEEAVADFEAGRGVKLSELRGRLKNAL